MALVQEIKDGLVQSEKTKGSTSDKAKSAGDTKQMFLQLLVTEMQYQDPLQPTDNSQYVQEMATFSQVEALNTVSASMQDMQSANFVGKYVTISDAESGEETSGYVDYVTMDGNDRKVSIEGTLYDADSVTSVQDASFYEAGVLADTFAGLIAKLPTETYVALTDKQNITAARSVYNSFNDYQKTFVKQEDLAKLTALEARIKTMEENAAELQKKKEEEAKATAATQTTETQATETV